MIGWLEFGSLLGFFTQILSTWMEQAMLYLVVSYDITEDRRRNRVAKLMENYGTRVQYSVFECLLQEQSLLELQEQLQAILDLETDSVRFYRLCVRCRAGIEIFGRGTTQSEEPFVIL